MSEELIVRHCSPTLAGLKTGNMFSCRFHTVEQLREDIRRMNRRLAAKGLRILPLRIGERSALIYVYRPNKLQRDLAQGEACSILAQNGYACDKPSRCIARLRSRLQEQTDFPHEIGLFLGYPPEDVRGFIDNRSPKLVGCWKVYGDEEKAKTLFGKYKHCTDVYIRQLTHGNTIERLTVAV